VAFFDNLRLRSAANRLLEERLYEQVVGELANGVRRDGLWAKAIALSDGSTERAKALYIQFRVQSLKDEQEIARNVAEQAGKLAEATPLTVFQERVNRCVAVLDPKGYEIQPKGNGWLISEPLGGKQQIGSLEELEQYASERQSR
jgi:hypothetical protein